MHGLRDIEYVELWVEDAFAIAAMYEDTFGFERVAETAFESVVTGCQSVVLAQGDAIIIVTSSTRSDDMVAKFVERHGDGVRDVAFAVDDAREVFEKAISGGAPSIQEPSVWASNGGKVVRATIGGFDDVVHSLVQRDVPFVEALPPGYQPVKRTRRSRPFRFHAIDHLAMCLPAGKMDEVAEYYKRALGFEDGHREQVYTERSGMNARVVQCGPIKFPLHEPLAANATGPIAEFLDLNCGGGVYHVALLTDDIIPTLRELEGNHVDILPTPHPYYDMLPGRVGPIDECVDDLRDLNVLVDRDAWGYLLQVFTRSLHRRQTLFLEVIQRKEARGFGSGNIRALFDAVECDRLALLQMNSN